MYQVATIGHDSTTAPSPTRVLLVDAHEACRQAMTTLITRSKYRLSVVAEAPSPEAGGHLATSASPHAIIVGLEGDDDPGVIAGLCVRAPDAGVLVVSARADGGAVLASLKAGALGFIPTWVEPEEIIEALMLVAGGDIAIHPSVSSVGRRLAPHPLESGGLRARG